MRSSPHPVIRVVSAEISRNVHSLAPAAVHFSDAVRKSALGVHPPGMPASDSPHTPDTILVHFSSLHVFCTGCGGDNLSPTVVGDVVVVVAVAVVVVMVKDVEEDVKEDLYVEEVAGDVVVGVVDVGVTVVGPIAVMGVDVTDDSGVAAVDVVSVVVKEEDIMCGVISSALLSSSPSPDVDPDPLLS